MTRARAFGRPLAIVAGLVLAHEALARALDWTGVLDALLAPTGLGLIFALLGGLALILLRLGLVFVAPGWLLVQLVLAARAAPRAEERPGAPVAP